ncbi:response regulator [Fimbriimonas ginsengisoli]|uniref:Response regulator receiver protein n=1 Tax=Fimbriimonas ginsengisoli Gsoil 348 TaxID=661478 RepID=A0A068NRQ0_FIMGI|nr:response regulator [Fimbriimonas ginsengisoli]AIE84294.1 response regulator receiver protein [Fimbriimonas ginsengisoli Gsoil 348]
MNESLKILLVEDNPDDEQLTMRALRKLTPKVNADVARDGQEAWDYLSDPSRPLPNLVLLDLKLPKISGLELLERLRKVERTKYLLVVVLTSSDEPSDVRASYRQYANSYIRKPVAYEEFGDVVRQLGLYWLDTNILPPS